MNDQNPPTKNTLFIEVSGAGLPEVDGLYVPSAEPPKESESGTLSSLGYWNGKMAWDRADKKSKRSPAISYSNTYKSWRICRLDGHLAYDNTCNEELPPTEREWHVYKKGVAPAPKVVIHHYDPRMPCPEPNILFVIGGPGSGKGTMCKLAELQLGWHHLSAGDLLRAEINAGGETAELIEDIITKGELVPTSLSVTLLKNAIERLIRTTGKVNFLIDGFPRSIENAQGWFNIFGKDSPIPTMLYFECPYPVLEKRILGRAKYSGRSDDNVESIKLRFDTFKAETLPTVELFRSKNKCVEINSGRDRQLVFSDLAEHLSEFTENEFADLPLSEEAEMLLGLRPYPSKTTP